MLKGVVMRKMSSQYTLVYKVMGFAVCLILAAVASEVLFIQSLGLVFNFALAMLIITGAFALQIVSFKLCDVLLDRDRIMLKGIGKSEYVLTRKIVDLKERQFLCFQIVSLDFDDKTSFGNVAVFIPGKADVDDQETASVEDLKKILEKDPADKKAPSAEDDLLEEEIITSR